MGERKTRIRPVRAGEEVLFDPIREDLQDEYERSEDAREEAEVSHSVILDFRRHNPKSPVPKDMLKDFYLKHMKSQTVSVEFWIHLRTVYDIWDFPLGIRSGYVLVKDFSIGPMRQIQL